MPIKVPLGTSIVIALTTTNQSCQQWCFDKIYKLLEILMKAGWISSVYADRAQTKYADTIKNKKIIDVVHKFDIIEDRLDDFYMRSLNQLQIHLCEAAKLCLILSHGNARVESGFSINSKIIKNNLK